eukprot:338236_1
MANKQSNINQICFCGKSMKQYPIQLKEWHCRCCCKRRNDKIVYACGRWKQCEYYIQVGRVYQICYECFNVLDNDENKDNLKVRKIKSMGKIINNQMKLCKNNQQRRTYLVNVYDRLKTGDRKST